MLPADAEPFEREIPSMLLRMAAHLGLTPITLRGLSAAAIDVLDETAWDGQFGRDLDPVAIAELATAGLVSPIGTRTTFTHAAVEQLDLLSRALRGQPPSR